MITQEIVNTLTSDEKDRIILDQAAQIIAFEAQILVLEARIEALEASLLGNKKTSKNSSTPPSRDPKGNIPNKEKGRRENSVGRTGHARDLHADPDETVASKFKNCPKCGGALGEDEQKLAAEYDRIEIPPLRPKVTRVHLYACTCKTYGAIHKAPAPQGFEEGSPFGSSVEGLATYLRYSHHTSYKGLCELFLHVFGLSISQGGFANLFKRLNTCFDPITQAILTRIQSSRVVCSDETSARVNGKNQWEWVFQNKDVCLHVIRPLRNAQVVQDVMGEHRPTYWLSDLYSAQIMGHAKKLQICLAHQLRDCQAGIEGGDFLFCWRLKRLFLRAIVMSKQRSDIKPETSKGYRRRLEKTLDEILTSTPETKAGVRLKKRYLKQRDSLFTFFEDPSLEPTNNSSERALRPSVIFRKVTNGFRSSWGADFFGTVR
jgi:transposase